MTESRILKREQPALSVIIVSYNTADLIGNCLKSVLATDNLTRDVFVVDNASTDGSQAFIQDNFPSVHFIPNTENVGFAAANNRALSKCKGEYIFFLNPDTEVLPDTLYQAVAFMDATPRVGLAGTKIINPDGTPQWSVSYKYPGQRYATKELSGLPGDIASVLGAGIIGRAELIKAAGGFDENFFLYGEDQDLCLRIRKMGYEIGYTDSATVVHVGGQSERGSLPAAVWKKKIHAEYLFYSKHYMPRTIERIKRAQTIQANWRLLTLMICYPFARNKEKVREKIEKYRIARCEAKNFSYEKTARGRK